MVTILLDNIANDELVYTRLVILCGRVVEEQEAERGEDGQIVVEAMLPTGRSHPIEEATRHTWEVNAGHFKVLLPLAIGDNEVHLSFRRLRGDKQAVAQTTLRLRYERNEDVPPLQLCILAAQDSLLYSPATSEPQNNGKESASRTGKMKTLKGRLLGSTNSRRGYESSQDEAGPRALVDAPPGHARERLRRGGLQEIKRRLCLQAYLWQAFHAEEMRRHGLGRRAFQLEDLDSSSNRVTKQCPLSDLGNVHVLRSRHTLAEFLDRENAQQQKNAKNGGAMHAFAGEAIREAANSGEMPFHHDSPLAVLILDTRWDHEANLLRGHAAVGGASRDGFSYGVMGSHWLWSAPSSLNEVTASFTNEAKTETRFVVNDLGECPTAWQTLNIGSGAMMHEVGHALDNPHWPDGIMARDYVEFNRAFCTREPPRLPGTKEPMRPITPQNDSGKNHLHRCQAVRAFHHPCFRIPADADLWGPRQASTSISPGLEARGPLLSNEAGIASIEISIAGQHRTHIEYVGRATAERTTGKCDHDGGDIKSRTISNGVAPPKKLELSPTYLNQLLQLNVLDPRSPTISLRIVGANLRQEELSDYRAQGIVQRVHNIGQTEDPRPVYKFVATGKQEGGSLRQTILFPSKLQPTVYTMIGIDIFAGAAVDALTFHFQNRNTLARSTAHIGPPQIGKAPRAQFAIRNASDSLERIELRSGWWIDAINVVMKSGAASGWYGNLEGGSLRVLEPASADQEIVGLYCSAGDWCDSIGLLVR